MFYEKDDVIKEYESTISQIKKNTNNKTVSKYLENTLSMFCYDMLADSTAGFTYEDGSLPKIGMQQAEIQSESDYKTALFIAYDITKPNSTLRGILYKPNSEGKKFYISKNDLIFVIINPVIKNGKVLYADIQDRNQLNICFEAHKLIKEKNSKTIYLTYSAPKKYPNLESLTHIYETMCFYRLNKPYRFDKI
jgi:hypothetical protein